MPDGSALPISWRGFADAETVLYDCHTDPGQTTPIHAPEIAARMTRAIAAELAAHDAPDELYDRFELAR